MDSIIQVTNLKKAFDIDGMKQEILKGLNFEIKKSSFTSIMGPSGCGKSTLLYILGGLDDPTEGDVKICGRSYKELSKNEKAAMKRQQMGFVFQFYNLVPNLTVEDNIMLPILLDGKKRSAYKERYNEILEITGLTNKTKHTPRELSGGQQQRVAIARALIFKPEIVLADEPIGNLDSKSGKIIMELFRTINREYKTTIVQVTHSPESALYGDSIIRMLDGNIQAFETINSGEESTHEIGQP